MGDKAFLSGFGQGGTVLCTHPFPENAPATIDFGELTKDRAGKLTLLRIVILIRMAAELVVKRDGRKVGDTRVTVADGWKEITVTFSKNTVVVETTPLAGGWSSCSSSTRSLTFADFGQDHETGSRWLHASHLVADPGAMITRDPPSSRCPDLHHHTPGTSR